MVFPNLPYSSSLVVRPTISGIPWCLMEQNKAEPIKTLSEVMTLKESQKCMIAARQGDRTAMRSKPSGASKSHVTSRSHIQSRSVTRTKRTRLLEAALYEYLQRYECYNQAPVDAFQLQYTAKSLASILNLTLNINENWLQRYCIVYRIDDRLSVGRMSRVPPRSLDLQQIIRICERNAEEVVNQQDILVDNDLSHHNSKTSRRSYREVVTSDDCAPPQKRGRPTPTRAPKTDAITAFNQSSLELKTTDEAINYLKPLFDFAIKNEKFYMIYLLATLKNILLKAKEKENEKK